MEKKIKNILIEGSGYIYYLPESNNPNHMKPIEPFLVNGEMAHVTWYRQGNKEFNGKYVIQIEYYE